MNIIFTALAALSGITGFSSGHFYETNNEHLQDCLFEHFGSCSSLATEDSFLLIDDLYAMDGTNRYLLADMIDGKTVVYDKKEQCVSVTYDTNPYIGLNVEFKLLSDIENNYMFAYYNEEIQDFVFTNNTCFDKESIHSYYTNQGYKAGNYYKGIAYTSDTVKIDNAFYFERLGSRHAHNADGTCTVVAAEMLLGEFDISFYSTSDVLTTSNSSIEFSILTQKSDGTFDWVYKENLLEKNISADRNSPTRMKYNFIDEEAYGFRFIVRAPATGTSNGGRVCIGLVSIQNTTYDHGLFGNF